MALSSFIDLFAGIGGFHLALKTLELECVFASEWNRYAQSTYQANFKHLPFGDIHKVEAKDIPAFDMLCGGFPCQPFSIAGVSKKNSLGEKHGFEDQKQGNLFFEIIRLAAYHRPKVIFLENVKNLKSHDKGRTWQVITKELKGLDYQVFAQVMDGKYFVPQHRERVFIIAFDKKRYPDIDFHFPTYPEKRLYELNEVLEAEVDPKYTLSDKLWSYLQARKELQQQKGNGFGFGLIDPSQDAYTRTISARYYKDGSEVLIAQKNQNPRRLTPRECARLQGFPESFVIPVSDAQAYRQFGNSVVMPLVKSIAEKILATLELYEQNLARIKVIQPALFDLAHD
ncbi:MAG: DNA (cytosine-5-)-methyltransferase [Deinococcales bacterium]